MKENIGRKVHPGLKISKYSGQQLGYGLYSRQNAIYSSAVGNIKQSTTSTGPIYSVSNNLPNKKVGVKVGDIIYAKVLKIKQEECIVQILQVNEIPCFVKIGRGLEGAIRKENVREKMVDSVQIIQCFKPKDIVKAKVISLGDSLRGLYLSTAAEDLGVLVAQHQQSCRLMLPFDWTSMVDPQNLLKQPRKVCKPQ